MYEKLVDFVSKQLDLDPAKITPDSTFASLGIDSLDMVEMVMSLEEKLGVELDTENQKLTTMQEFVDFVESKLK